MFRQISLLAASALALSICGCSASNLTGSGNAASTANPVQTSLAQPTAATATPAPSSAEQLTGTATAEAAAKASLAASDIQDILQDDLRELLNAFKGQYIWQTADVPWSELSFRAVNLPKYGLSALFYDQSPLSRPFAVILHPELSQTPLPGLGGVSADADFAANAKRQPNATVEDTWVAERANTARKLSYVTGELNVSYISASRQGDPPFFYIRLDESFLSQGQDAHQPVYNKDQAFDLLDQRMPDIKSNFSFTGLVNDGDFTFTSFSQGVGETVTYIVDHDTGNVFDDVSGFSLDNLYMADGMQILMPDDMISRLKRIAGYKDYDIQFYGAERGMYLLDFYRNGALEKRYKADPVSGDLLENTETRSLVVNVRGQK